MKFSIGSKIATGFALGLVALLTISMVSYQNIKELNDDAFWVTHTVEVLQRLESLSDGLMQAQSAARGNALAPSDAFQATFRAASAEMNSELGTLRNLTIDNPHQTDRLDKLGPIIAIRLGELQKLMTLNAAIPAERDVQTAMVMRSGQQTADQILDLISQMENEERALLEARRLKSTAASTFTSATIIVGTSLAFLIVGGIGFLIVRSITNPLKVLTTGAEKLGAGDYHHRVLIGSTDEVGQLAATFNQMGEQIEQRQAELAEQDWLKSSLTRFSSLLQGQRDPAVICHSVLAELATLLEARHSVIYLPEENAAVPVLKLFASYAFDHPQPELKPGEGLVGQGYREQKRIQLREIPADYVKIRSALGEARPTAIVVQPAVFDGRVKAVLELATFQPLTEIQLVFLEQFAQGLAVVLNSVEAGLRTERLLKQSQALSASLQAQTDRLRESEVMLQEQQEELRQSNEELEQTNEELRQTGEEIEEKANLLAEQKRQAEKANQELEQARFSLEDKARQLSRASKYKSEFLANMSHELRTPLNSLMILSKMLEENADNNLSTKQVQYAKTIHSSGSELLELINEILDLSKIEAGKVEVEPDDMSLTDLAQFVEESFRYVADSKRLQLKVELDPHLPRTMITDARRLRQVIKNLLSNAFKFTEKGTVEFRAGPTRAGWSSQCETLNQASTVIAFSVTDTGIGIPADKQDIIFEAFQQADAGTARKFGGTGLGLSISREIARLLGGWLGVQSTPGQGSRFTLYLPLTLPNQDQATRNPRSYRRSVMAGPAPATTVPAGTSPMALPVDLPEPVPDDRNNLQQGDLILLIIEDDRNFAGVLVEFAREKRFKTVVAQTAAHGILMASQLKPSAIMLDIQLPDNDGWMVLDWLKHDPKTRHIPVHIVTVEEERDRSLRLGAVSFLQKPVTKQTLDDALNQTLEFINRPVKKLLVVEDVSVQRQNIVDLIGNGDVKATAVGTGAEALAALAKDRYDCIVMDLGLPDMGGPELIREIQKRLGHRSPPIIVYTSKELTRSEETELRKISESIVIKDVRSPERLLDETALFLHRVQSRLPEPKRRMIEQVRKTDSILTNRKVLVVDDDVRNIFAITSALESYQMKVLYAENGQAGIDLLKSNPDIEIVLMDVMMPEMDGYEAIRRIREIDQFKKLPIISVTAKAMKGDREKCLEVGASDYITKPVDMDQLRSLLRVWLYK